MVCDGVISVRDVDRVLSRGFGMRYAFFGPIETLHMNAEGIADHQRVYGAGVERVCRAAGLPIPPLQDPHAVEDIAQQMEQIIPVAKLEAWREYREKCLAALNKLKRELEKEKPV